MNVEINGQGTRELQDSPIPMALHKVDSLASGLTADLNIINAEQQHSQLD